MGIVDYHTYLGTFAQHYTIQFEFAVGLIKYSQIKGRRKRL